jgi:hypothetical protein
MTPVIPMSDLDPIVELMQQLGLQVTQRSWLEFNFPEGVPDPLPGELWASIPPELRGK